MKRICFVALFILSGVPVWAQESTDTKEVQIVKEFLHGVSTKNREITHRLLDENVSWDQPGNNVLSGKKKTAAEVFTMSGQMHTISQGTFQLKDYKVLGINGNQVICQLHFTAIRPEGAWLDVQNTDVYTITNGKITQAQVFSADVSQEDFFWGR